jgi:hypothetical protein
LNLQFRPLDNFTAVLILLPDSMLKLFNLLK